MAKWPKLSQTLTHPKNPRVCQSCGANGLMPGWEYNDQKHKVYNGSAFVMEKRTAVTISPLQMWREHDDHDKPTGTVVILCKSCADRIIVPHPRLYAEVMIHTPVPGATPICEDCDHRIGTLCPMTKANDGPGVEMIYPKPMSAFVCVRGGKGSGLRTAYTGPVKSCSQRIEIKTTQEIAPESHRIDSPGLSTKTKPNHDSG